MITADKPALLISMPTAMLEMALPAKKRPKLVESCFLGITNGHEFCYAVTDSDGGAGKVFLTYDPTVDKVFGKLS